MKLLKKLVSAILAVIVVAVTFVSVGTEKANAEIVSTNDYHLYKEMALPYAYGMIIPKTYTVKTTIRTFASDIPMFKNPQDMFIDEEDMIYVVDTGNNRIVKMDSYGNPVFSVSKLVCKDHQEEPDDNCDTCNAINTDTFKSPMGIFVDSDHDMYIADTDNQRIVHLDNEGYYIEEFGKPKDKAIEDYPFDVTKIYISNKGVIYLLLKTDFQGFMMLNTKGEYMGNTGMTWTTSNFVSYIWSKLFSKNNIVRSTLVAPPYSNFIIDDNNWIYATVINTGENQISKINSTGTSVYPKGKYGRDYFELIDETSFESEQKVSRFVDITVDKDGIIYVLDDKIGNVFLYDQEGNNLAYFGQLGSNRGNFQTPVAIGLLQDTSVVVLDAGTGYITVFKPTEFCNLVKKGTTLYQAAEYEEARAVWEELLKIDVNYIFAHKSIAKSYFKEKDYYAAMDEYKLALDKKGYSDSFDKQKALVTKEYFFLLVLIVICLIVYVVIGYKKLRRYADKLHIKLTTWGGDDL